MHNNNMSRQSYQLISSYTEKSYVSYTSFVVYKTLLTIYDKQLAFQFTNDPISYNTV
jgi:hypothetical protein